MFFPILKTEAFLWVPSLYKHDRLLMNNLLCIFHQNLWIPSAIYWYYCILHAGKSGENPKSFKNVVRMTHKHHPHPWGTASHGAFTISDFPAGFSSWFISLLLLDNWLKGCAQKFSSTTKWRLLVCSSVISLPTIKYHCLPHLSPCLNIAFFSWLPQTVTDAADTHALTQHIMWTVNRQ